MLTEHRDGEVWGENRQFYSGFPKPDVRLTHSGNLISFIVVESTSLLCDRSNFITIFYIELFNL